MTDLVALLEQTKEKVLRYRGAGGIGEQNTKAALIDPVFRALGWDMSDPDETPREYKAKRQDNPVDYAFLIGGTPKLFVEAKALGSNLDDRRWASQVVSYAAVAGVDWVVLTDGDDYRIYNAHAPVPIEDKLLGSARVSVDPSDAAQILCLLAKDSLRQGALARLWSRVFVDRRVQDQVTALFSPDPDPSLVRLLAKKLPDLARVDIRQALTRVRISAATEDSRQPLGQETTVAVPATRAAGSVTSGRYLQGVMGYLSAQPEGRGDWPGLLAFAQEKLPLGPAEWETDGRGIPQWRNRLRGAIAALSRRGQLRKLNAGEWVLLGGQVASPATPADTARRGTGPKRPGVSLSDLVAAGIVIPPLAIEASYKGQRLVATIHSDGTLAFQGQRFLTLSDAGGRARGMVSGDRETYSTNGWTFWSYRDTQGVRKPMAELRDRYLAQQAHPNRDPSQAGTDGGA